jgi:hypothetical protein
VDGAGSGGFQVAGGCLVQQAALLAQAPQGGITAVRIEALPDSSLPAGGPGRAKNGNFVLSELRLAVAPRSEPDKVATAPLQNASADFNQEGWHVRGAVDGNDATGWAIMPAFNKAHEAIFETAGDVGFADGCLLKLELEQQFPDGLHSLGRFRVSVTSARRPVGVQRLPAELAAALSTPASGRSEAQQALVASHFRGQDAEYQRRKTEVQRGEEELKDSRLIGAQDIAWALINSPAFLFNR